MKKRDTWMAFYVTDYLGDTMHLSTVQHGAYLLLLLACWKGGAELPDDDAQLAAITRLPVPEWKKHATVLRAFFDACDGKLMHRRVAHELAKAKELSATRSGVGRLGGRPPNDKQIETNRFRDAKAKPKQPETPSQNTTCSTEIPPIPPKGSKAAIGIRDWIDAERSEGRKAVPTDDPVFAYADSSGIPREYLHLAWLEFRDRYSAPEAKKYRDWRAVFRKAVRGNWLKLWWVDPGSGNYALTTVGMQADRLHNQARAA